MTDDPKLVEQVFDLALAGNDTEIAARKDALWTVGVTLISDVLLRADPLEQEKLLRGLELELRRALNLGLPPPIPRGTMPRYLPSGPVGAMLYEVNADKQFLVPTDEQPPPAETGKKIDEDAHKREIKGFREYIYGKE